MLPNLSALSIGAFQGKKRDYRGLPIEGESFESLRTEHSKHDPPFEVAGMLQSTVLSFAPSSFSSSGGRPSWNKIHIDELVLRPEYRRGGIGTWLMAKWVQRESKNAADKKGDISARLANALKGNAIARRGVRADGVVEPFITLCVDEDNDKARLFYKRLNFVELPGDEQNCDGRIECVVSLATLTNRLSGRADVVPKALEKRQRVRIEFTGPELEGLLLSYVPRNVGYVNFSTGLFERGLAIKDPAVTLAVMIADFYEEEFQEAIQEEVRRGAALLPIGRSNGLLADGSVTKAVINLFTLDRLLLWKNPRVTMREDDFNSMRAVRQYIPERTDLEQWQITRYIVLFDRPE